MTAAERAARDLRRDLRKLCDATTIALEALDEEMRKPSDVERGKRIAAILNALDLAHDGARHFGLGESFGKIERWRNVARRALRSAPLPEGKK